MEAEANASRPFCSNLLSGWIMMTVRKMCRSTPKLNNIGKRLSPALGSLSHRQAIYFTRSRRWVISCVTCHNVPTPTRSSKELKMWTSCGAQKHTPHLWSFANESGNRGRKQFSAINKGQQRADSDDALTSSADAIHFNAHVSSSPSSLIRILLA